MNALKIGAIVLALALIGTCSFIVLQQLSNADLNQQLSTTKNDLVTAQNDLSMIRTRLTSTGDKLNSSELFVNTYLKAYGLFLISSNLSNTSMSNYNLAVTYYNSDNWNNAIHYYTLAKDGDINESQLDVLSANYFKNASRLTNNTIYQNLCNNYYDLMMTYSRYDTHRSIKAEYMISACQAFKNGDYTTGNDDVMKSNVELDRANEELTNANTYLDESINIWKQI